jgi:hypothetical protein
MTTRRNRPNTRASSQKNVKVNGTIHRSNGWITARIYGAPFDRGFAHGYLLYKELKSVGPILKHLVKTYFKTSLSEYLERCKASIHPHLKNPEWGFIEQELHGICAGYKKRTSHSDITYDLLVGWNSYLSFSEIYASFNKEKNAIADVVEQRCSAFIATGSATHDGKIIMAHNTHTFFLTGFASNIALYVYPEDPDSAFMMQVAPGLISSSADWFITQRGIVGCETTIANISYVPDFTQNVPYFLRIRKAMEQGKTMDDYVAIMSDRNAGDYACSWLFGDIRTNEIMRFEQGFKTSDVKRTHNGTFHGMNTAISPVLRALETTDTGLEDPHSGTGARNLRFEYLLRKPGLSIADAKRIISDHYDVGENRENKGSRTICKHGECADQFAPTGATDGKVVDSEMARTMSFEGIMGSSCGRVFHKKDYPDYSPKHGHWKKLVSNMPKWPWAKIKEP